jgi:enoyl-CoA hydratase/carnithine racemase
MTTGKLDTQERALIKDPRGDQTMFDFVTTRINDSLFEIVLNRTDKRNAIHWPMLQELGAAIEQAEQTPGVRAVIVRGEGTGFSSGIELHAFAQLPETFGANWSAHMLNVTGAFQAIVTKFERSAVPTIALLHGYVLGLGLELALACDIRLAARGTKLGLPEARLGIIPDVGGTTRLTRLIGPARAKEVIMTGRMIDAAEAERLGMVNAVVPRDELRARGEALAAEIALSAPLAVTYAKRVIDGMAEIDRGLQMEAWAQAHLVQTADFQNGLQAMIAKSAPHWQGK